MTPSFARYEGFNPRIAPTPRALASFGRLATVTRSHWRECPRRRPVAAPRPGTSDIVPRAASFNRVETVRAIDLGMPEIRDHHREGIAPAPGLVPRGKASITAWPPSPLVTTMNAVSHPPPRRRQRFEQHRNHRQHQDTQPRGAAPPVAGGNRRGKPRSWPVIAKPAHGGPCAGSPLSISMSFAVGRCIASCHIRTSPPESLATLIYPWWVKNGSIHLSPLVPSIPMPAVDDLNLNEFANRRLFRNQLPSPATTRRLPMVSVPNHRHASRLEDQIGGERFPGFHCGATDRPADPGPVGPTFDCKCRASVHSLQRARVRSPPCAQEIHLYTEPHTLGLPFDG